MVIRGYKWLPVVTSDHMCAILSNTFVNVKLDEIKAQMAATENVTNVFNFGRDEQHYYIWYNCQIWSNCVPTCDNKLVADLESTKMSYLLLLRNANPLDILLFHYSYAPLELFTDFVRRSVECLTGHHTSCMSSLGQLHMEMFVVRAGWKPRPTNEHREVLFMDTFSSVSR